MTPSHTPSPELEKFLGMSAMEKGELVLGYCSMNGKGAQFSLRKSMTYIFSIPDDHTEFAIVQDKLRKIMENLSGSGKIKKLRANYYECL